MQGRMLVVLILSTTTFGLLASFPSVAQMEGNSTVKTKGASGEQYVFESKEIVFPEGGGFLSDAKMRGSGQLAYKKEKETLLLTAGKVTVSAQDKIVVELPRKSWNSEVNKATLFCDGKRVIKWEDVKPGDFVTVAARSETAHTAVSVRKGLLLVKIGQPTEPSVPIDFDCK
jgi:hypothetical protein